MTKRRRESDSDDETTEDAAVFVDTSLGTSIAMHLSKSDTASEFKKKIVIEHRHCYPGMEIHVNSLKVERGSRLYLLSDRMLVWSAFHRVRKGWFLWVDASSTPSNQNPSELGLALPMKTMDVRSLDNNCGGPSSDINGTHTLQMALPDGADGTNEVLDIIPYIKYRNTPEKATDIQNCKETYPAKKKRKTMPDISGVVCVKVPDISVGSMDANGTIGKVKSKRKKTKVQETALNIQDATMVEQKLKGKNPETRKSNKKEEKHLPLNLDHEVEMPSSKAGLTQKKEQKITIPCKQKKIGKKSAKANLQNVETGKEESILSPGAVDVQLKLLDGSTLDAAHEVEEVPAVDGNEAGFVMSTQTKQTLEAVPAGKRETNRELQNSPSNVNIPVAEKENHIAEFLQVEKNTENTLTTGKSSRKKRKNKAITTSDVQEDSSVKNQHVIGENTIKFGNSGTEGIHVASSQVISRKSKKKLQEENDIVVNIQDTTEMEQTLKGKNLETHKTEEKEENTHLSLNLDHEVKMPSSTGLTQKKEHKIKDSSKKKKKKIEMNSANNNLQKSGTEQMYNDINGDSSGLLCMSTHHIPVETGKEESILSPRGVDVQSKLSNGSTLDVPHVVEEVPAVHGNEAEFVMSTQTKQNLEAVPSGKKEMNKEILNSPGYGHVDTPVVENENQIVEFLQVEKDTENAVNTGKSARKKRKSRKIAATDVQEDLSVKNQSVIGLSTVGNSIKSEVISRKSKEKLQEENDVVNIQDATEVEQTLKDRNPEPHKTEEKEEETHLPLNLDHEVVKPSSYKAGLTLKKEHKIMTPSKKKKIEKKSAHTSLQKSGTEQTYNDISGGPSGSLFLSTHIPVETGKGESIISSREADVKLKVLNGSTLDVAHVVEEVPPADGNEADFVMSTPTKQTLEAVPSGKSVMNKEIQNSPANGHVDIPAVEKENQIVELRQVGKDNENTVNTSKGAEKKIKNKTITASDVQKDLPVSNQNIVIGSSNEESSIKFGGSGMEGIHVASSQVISPKSKETLQEEHDNVVYTDDLARTTENEGEGVNFKQYFVPDNYQGKSGSHGKVKKSNQSDKENEMKTLKELKNNGLSSVSISTEVQSSSKLSRDGERRNKSRVREDSGKKKRDSTENSNRDEVIPNSSMRSTRGSKKRPQDSVTGEIPETIFKKHKEILAGSSLPMKKNISLKKSILESTERFPEKNGNKTPHLDVNVTNMMELKTPKKKSLLTKVGSFFQDDSGESSADENGTAHSSDSTQSPSDSSSTSDHSVGESISSLDTTRNGVKDAQVISGEGKDTPMLDRLSSKNVTMKMLLQSSSRFKKIKELASQNEAYRDDILPFEFGPDDNQL